MGSQEDTLSRGARAALYATAVSARELRPAAQNTFSSYGTCYDMKWRPFGGATRKRACGTSRF